MPIVGLHSLDGAHMKACLHQPVAQENRVVEPGPARCSPPAIAWPGNVIFLTNLNDRDPPKSPCGQTENWR